MSLALAHPLWGLIDMASWCWVWSTRRLQSDMEAREHRMARYLFLLPLYFLNTNQNPIKTNLQGDIPTDLASLRYTPL